MDNFGIGNCPIKFRAWTGKEITEDPLHRCDASNVLNKKSIYKDWVLMQFTGLSDKNGVEIYEGDIIKGYRFIQNDDGSYTLGSSAPKEEYLEIVRFSEKGICVGFNISSSCARKEVIGNVFEDSHLINQ